VEQTKFIFHPEIGNMCAASTLLVLMLSDEMRVSIKRRWLRARDAPFIQIPLRFDGSNQ
jgi:hypothetical protein